MQRRATDGRDLNRQFPGNSSGNHSQRLAHALFSSIVPKSDFLIDIHTAPGTRVNLPHIRANFDNKDCKFLARAFGTNIVLHSLGSEGTMRREATNSGCPSILLETGSSNSFQIKNVEADTKAPEQLKAENVDSKKEEPKVEAEAKPAEESKAEAAEESSKEQDKAAENKSDDNK